MQGGTSTSLYRVETRAVDVSVWMARGFVVRGDMFLRPSLLTENGLETIAGRMNDRDAFLPVRVREGSERTLLLGKAQIRYISAEGLAPHEAMVAATHAQPAAFRVELRLDEGETLRGTCYAGLPPGKRRLLDYFNAPLDGPFVPLFSTERQYVVHRAYVSAIAEQEE